MEKKHNNIFLIVVTLACILLIFIPTHFENFLLTDTYERVKGEIMEVDNDDLTHQSIIITGTQNIKIKILRGKFKDNVVEAKNIMIGQKKLDKVYNVGDKVMTLIKVNKEKNTILSARADGIYRIDTEIILFILFALFLIGFAKFTGFKALISFVFTALVFWKILIPSYLNGYSPIIISLLIIILVTAIIILLVSGFNKKGYVALLGASAGIGITTSLALLFGYFFKIPGTTQEFSEALLYMGYSHLNLSNIFISCIFISAAGAVMDVAMDIAAAQNEIVEKKPTITTKELIKSGFNIAYPVIGTMTTTLLFAYSGSFMFVFMAFMAKGTPLISVFNTNYIAAEILHTLVGSFGLVLVAPITAIIGGYYYKK